ncbi:MAG: hypothetical protein A2231_12755 [Candidatus Firestonebacteria bacterium RIFOXYA2_FULL_40_8]|nr:MAG: hypothetical protein A2231_12755 [Candidatus Firestonebacteria bacterium RIFOXYA2_FULL_40_8]
MFYKLLAILIGLAIAALGFWFVRGALGYFIESVVDLIIYFIHNLASIFIFVIGFITALITVGEAMEKKR